MMTQPAAWPTMTGYVAEKIPAKMLGHVFTVNRMDS